MRLVYRSKEALLLALQVLALLYHRLLHQLLLLVHLLLHGLHALSHHPHLLLPMSLHCLEMCFADDRVSSAAVENHLWHRLAVVDGPIRVLVRQVDRLRLCRHRPFDRPGAA